MIMTNHVCMTDISQSGAQPILGKTRPRIPVSGLSRLSQSDGIIFHGTKSGRATTASVMPTQNLRLGMQSAIVIPRGICISKTSIENSALRPKTGSEAIRTDDFFTPFGAYPKPRVQNEDVKERLVDDRYQRDQPNKPRTCTAGNTNTQPELLRSFI